jgi:hypothetical protein
LLRGLRRLTITHLHHAEMVGVPVYSKFELLHTGLRFSSPSSQPQPTADNDLKPYARLCYTKPITMNRASKTPGISRIDQPSHRTHGFFVRLARRSKIHSAFFSDIKHGGREQALGAAKAHYLKLRQKLGLPRRHSRRQWAQTVRRRGKSGIQGVRRVLFCGQSGRLLKYWMATWSPELGMVRKKAFSIRKFGEAKAQRLAIRARREGVLSMK